MKECEDAAAEGLRLSGVDPLRFRSKMFLLERLAYSRPQESPSDSTLGGVTSRKRVGRERENLWKMFAKVRPFEAYQPNL